MISFPREEVFGVVGERFRRVAAAIPDRTAMKTPRASLTYAALDRISEDLAKAIVARRGPAAEPVALLLDQGVDSIAALLGIMKAGKSAVVLDPDFPLGRLNAIWEDAEKPLVVTNPSFVSLAAGLTGSPEGWLDLRAKQDQTAGLESVMLRPDSIAALFYTSGTTGEPKGVMMSHEMVLHTAWHNCDRYQITGNDSFALVSSQGFGASTALSLSAVLGGAAFFPITHQVRELHSLIEILGREEITILAMPSLALLRQQEDAMTARVSLPCLRHVLIGGEELHRRDIERFRNFFPESVEFSYRIASSETMMMSELRIAPGTAIPWEKIPVGRIIPDKELLLWDENRRPVPAGQIGEIVIRSRYLASGYWKKPELTNAKFFPDPEGGDRRLCRTGDMGRLLPDGLLEHTGRKDSLIRVRGFSVQMEAVEKALKGLPGVQEAAVGAFPFRGGNNRLVAYIVPEGEAAPTVRDLRTGLTGVLTYQMIPTMFVFLDSLPRTPSNRVDRQALPPPGTGRPDIDTPFAEPRSEMEKRLCDLWAELIGVKPVGVDDDFFLLGGDSLLAMHMALAAEDIYSWQIPSAFFQKPTIRRLVELWRKEHPESKDAPAGALRESSPGAVPAEQAPETRRSSEQARKRSGREAGIVGKIRNRTVRITAGILPEFAMHLPYDRGCRLLAGWCRRPRVVDLLYPRERDLFLAFVDSLGVRLDAPEDAFAACLMGNLIWSPRQRIRLYPLIISDFYSALRGSAYRFWRNLAWIMEHAPIDQYDRFFSFSGLEHLEQARRPGRGVILVTYHGHATNFVVPALIRRLDCAPIPTISFRKAFAAEGAAEDVRHAVIPKVPAERISAHAAEQILRGRRLLMEGGMVQVAPDSVIDPASPTPVVIAGREYRLKTGFAELAVQTEAAVVPLYCTRDLAGRISIVIRPALDSGAEGGGRTNRMVSLLRQYAAFVEQSWRSAPESLKWRVIRRYFTQPVGGKR
ncbi:MAG: AMP-binding protein [Anaerolineales bacterium]